MPSTWRFDTDDNKVLLLDEKNNIIAREVYQGWRVETTLDNGSYYSNWDNLPFNKDLELNVSNQNNYGDKSTDSFFEDVYFKKYTENFVSYICAFYKIYDYLNVEGFYELCLIFDTQIDYNIVVRASLTFISGN